uniref:Uncharacterized protein n=1 Tax=Pithovirus LCPAC001 TaxID=2506585 RepID=A0A481Z1W5_9VIRU|nr:MAG: hypothetical protein LCPAC001_02270 [Pithovirus LCPAC001]
MSFYTGGLHDVITSPQVNRADIKVNNLEVVADLVIDGDFDIKGEVCITSGGVDQVCLGASSLDRKAAGDFTVQNSDVTATSDLIFDCKAGDIDIKLNGVQQMKFDNAAGIIVAKNLNIDDNKIDNTGSGTSMRICGATGMITESLAGANQIKAMGANAIEFFTSNTLRLSLLAAGFTLQSNGSPLKIHEDAANALQVTFDKDELRMLRVATGSGHDCRMRFTLDEASDTHFVMGLDQDNGALGNKVFELCSGTSLGVDTVFVVDNTKIMNFSTGVTLPSSGATASTLDFYAQGSHATDWTGIWAADITSPLLFTRSGNMVTVRIPITLANATIGATITNTVAIPAYLRPASDVDWMVLVENDSATIASGLISLSTAGLFVISATISGGNFAGASGTSTSGVWKNQHFTYQIA